MPNEADFVTRHPTLDPVVGGFLIGVGRNSSYKGAKNEDLPVIKIGSQYRVVTAKLAEMLGMTDAQIAQAVALATAKLDEMRQQAEQGKGQRARGRPKRAERHRGRPDRCLNPPPSGRGPLALSRTEQEARADAENS